MKFVVFGERQRGSYRRTGTPARYARRAKVPVLQLVNSHLPLAFLAIMTSFVGTSLSADEFASRNAKTGAEIIPETRLPGIREIYASPVAAAGPVYVTDRDGTTLVLKHGNELDVLATNKLDEPIDASPALVGSELYPRAEKHLYCIANE